MKTPKAAALALAAVLVPAAGATAAPREHHAAQPRVVVADGSSSAVRVLDVRSGRRLGRFRLAGPAALTTLADGRHVIVAQSTRDRADAIDGGAWSDPHGDHVHHHTVAPRLLPFGRTIPRPVHVVGHGDEVALFADGSGDAHVFTLAALRRRGAAPRATLRTGTAHHGVAVPLGDRFVVSVADPADEPGTLPPTLEVRDGSGATLASGACPALHGEASGAAWAAFACENGIALVRPTGRPSFETLSYPAGATAQRRAFTLHGDDAERRLVGDFGDDALIVVSLASKRARTIEVGREVAAFGVDPRGGAILALTTDGLLRRIDPASGRQTARRRVVGRPFEPAWNRPAPKLTVARGLAAVSDPARRRVSVVATSRRLPLTRALTVPGAPTQVALVGAG